MGYRFTAVDSVVVEAANSPRSSFCYYENSRLYDCGLPIMVPRFATIKTVG